MSRNCSGWARGPGENARRPNSEALRPDLRLSRSRSQRPVRLRSLGELEARVSLKVSTMRAGSNHVRQPAVGQRDDGPDTPRRADLREGLKAQLRTGIHPDESRPSPHALATHHRRGPSTNDSSNHPAARGLCQSLTGLKRRQASTTDWSRSRSSSIREAPKMHAGQAVTWSFRPCLRASGRRRRVRRRRRVASCRGLRVRGCGSGTCTCRSSPRTSLRSR
ncbi:MAG: hypothetical protein QOF92_2213 [Pseudonocardiales bacterium]|nr:hypothetical protein [Pseudonocardiales bacterium]